MPNAQEMVYVKAVNGNVLIGSAPLDEGRHRLVPLTPAIRKAEEMGMVRTFRTEGEAAAYKFIPMSKKGIVSIHSFGDKPERSKYDSEKDYERALELWEGAQKKALVTPSGSPTPRAIEAEKETNAAPAAQAGAVGPDAAEADDAAPAEAPGAGEGENGAAPDRGHKKGPRRNGQG